MRSLLHRVETVFFSLPLSANLARVGRTTCDSRLFFHCAGNLSGSKRHFLPGYVLNNSDFFRNIPPLSGNWGSWTNWVLLTSPLFCPPFPQSSLNDWLNLDFRGDFRAIIVEIGPLWFSFPSLPILYLARRFVPRRLPMVSVHFILDY